VHSSELAFEKEVDEQMYMSKGPIEVDTSSSRQMTEKDLESSQHMSRTGNFSPAHSPSSGSSGSVHWKSNPVRCYMRIRPLPSRQALCVSVQDEVTITIKKGRNMRSATLDGVYPPESTQGELAEDVIDLAQCLLDGRNVCLISYGESRSGKTYTLVCLHILVPPVPHLSAHLNPTILEIYRAFPVTINVLFADVILLFLLFLLM
jgi:hypothetical protein